MSKNNGTVTISHFARILSYLDIMVSADDFNLLVKKYLKDSYTLNYIAFLAAIDETVAFMEKTGMLDIGGVNININDLLVKLIINNRIIVGFAWSISWSFD